MNMISPRDIDNGAPFDRGFNVAVLHIASRLFPTGYDVGPDAPDTLEKLNHHVATTGRMLVWSGASDWTIFGDAEVNWAFRAWHDWTHWRYQLPFTLDGESAAAGSQIRDIFDLYGRKPKWCNLIVCEVYAQAFHKERTGEFPADQRAFAREFLGMPV